MREEYDFSNGERGKFYHPSAKFELPVYLEDENLTFITEIARKKNQDISTVVNDLIRSDRQIADVIK